MHTFIEDPPTWLAVIAVVAFVTYSLVARLLTPIYVPDSYYNFADGRHDLGIPHTGDVLSNGAFMIVAIWGVFMVYRARDRVALKPGLAISLTTFFSAVFLVTFGSGYFHLDPGPDRIFLDRLPISLAAGAILATLLIDRWTPSQKGALLTFVGTMAFAIAGLWHVTATGDLRLYALSQAAPLILALLCAATWNSPQHLIPGRRLLFLALLYAGAKAAEVYDWELFAEFHWLSGHNLKHLLAASAAAMAVPSRRHS